MYFIIGNMNNILDIDCFFYINNLFIVLYFIEFMIGNIGGIIIKDNNWVF